VSSAFVAGYRARVRTLLLYLVALAACTTNGNGGAGHDGAVTHDGGGGGGGGPTADAPVLSADGALPMTSAVSIIVEPNGKGGDELVAAITAATTSVYMTMYELDDDDTINALVAKAKAHLDVQVILDSSTTNKSFNTDAYNKLAAAGAAVVWSSSVFTFTHEKTVIIDGATAWIMTMNSNTSSPTSNREYLAIDTDAGDVAESTAVFKADHAMQAITPTGALVVANANARSKLVDLIDSATTTLDVEGEEFSDTQSTGVVPAVSRAAKRGVAVHVVVGNAGPDAQADDLVTNSGGSVVVTGPMSGDGTKTNPYIHAKAIVVDCTATGCARGFIGSENFSTGSLGYNRELGVIFDAPAELLKVKTAIDTDFANGSAQ
jgi:phosphatidylserine/phosphatidylglycerophosphate/cardiolipin synthase-like enzyme